MSEELIRTSKKTLPKEIRITSKKQLDLLFMSGDSFIAYPLRVVFTKRDKTPEAEVAILVSVSKRKFKRAVKRNRVKRLIRETFRLNRHALQEALRPLPFSLDVAFLYLKNELPEYPEVEKAMLKAIDLLKTKVLDS
jgi:ribonuclease P protein component